MSSSVTNQKLTAWNYVVKFVISSDKWKQNKTKRSGYSRVKPEQRNGTEGGKQILQSRNQKIYKNLKRKTIKPFKDPQLGSIEPLRHAVERRQLKHNTRTCFLTDRSVSTEPVWFGGDVSGKLNPQMKR